MALRTWPVAVSRAVTVAPSMNAPLWSVTVPLMLARPSCAWSVIAGARTQIIKHRKNRRMTDGIKLAWLMCFSLQGGSGMDPDHIVLSCVSVIYRDSATLSTDFRNEFRKSGLWGFNARTISPGHRKNGRSE